MKEKRLHRTFIHEPGHAHELTFHCFQGYPFFSKDRTCSWLADSIANACQTQNVSLWAYVFMPNHVHLLIYPKNPHYSTAAFWKAIKWPVSRRSLDYLREQKSPWLEKMKRYYGQRVEYHFWQTGGGYDRNITEPKTLLHSIDYIHRNPVRKNLCEHAIDWKWSSAGWYLDFPQNSLAIDPIPYEWTLGKTGS